ncbi:hypothetical protein [Comamonas sp. JC664]|uniref:hypothetical protein n=1 Tax=Comamonas sp. JC664 TaxID=2801917 RepID=UPI00174C7591|nr:hypothetical protein [Comamonas sp. JC664]MBL0697258.1 hypothetical protein [Comamonas sp. JC664]GHG83388.1 hypothetical protein GCM10012319_38300 [Comamonas sp. KCTC 72670]
MGAQHLEQHRRILGILFIVINAVTLLLSAGVLVFFGAVGGLAPDVEPEGRAALVIIGVVAGGCLALLGLPGVITGLGLVNRKPWSRTVALVLGILALPNVPLGTALGVYALWFYLQPGSDQAFDR